jgi:hypothetical protein
VARIEAGKRSATKRTRRGLTLAAKMPTRPHRKLICFASDTKPKAAVRPPHARKPKIKGMARPNIATMEPVMNWPTAYMVSMAVSMPPRAARLRPISLCSVDLTTETGLRAK